MVLKRNDLKKKLYSLSTVLFLISIGMPQNKVNINNLVQYGDKMFRENDDIPYTGIVFDLSKSTGEKILEGRYKHGKKSGMWTHYTDDGNGKYKLNYGNGEINIDDFTDDFIENLNESGDKINTPASGIFIDEFGKRYQGRFVLDEDEVFKFKKFDGSYLELYSSLDDFSKYPWGFYSMKNEFFHGKIVRWYKNGKKKEEGDIKNGERIGVFTEWYENGKKKQEGGWRYGEDKIKRGGRDEYGRGQFWYENEKKDGLWIYYHENEQKKSKGTYKNGKEHGLWTSWYENGEKKEETTYNGGKEIETTKWEYYSTGQKKHEIKYNNGVPFGELFFWTENGERQKTEDFISYCRKYSLHSYIIPVMRELVTKNDDRSPKIQYQIGDIYLHDLKNFSKSIQEYRKVIRMFPGTSQEPESFFMIGYIYSNILNDLVSGEKVYKNFLKKFPNHELSSSVKFELNNLGVPIEDIQEKK